MTGLDRDPTVARYVARFPDLAAPVRRVLEQGAAVRRASDAAFGVDRVPEPAPEMAFEKDGLERIARAAGRLGDLGGGGRDRVRREASEAVAAVLDLRVRSHRLAPPRRTSSGAVRGELVRAIRSFGAAHRDLEEAAAAGHAPPPPWQATFSSHVAPGTPVADIELDGAGLPGTPVSRLPWGTRCWLTGRGFGRDSRRGGEPRHRSLEAWWMVLSPVAMAVTRQLRDALDGLGDDHHETVAAVRRMLPWLWHHFVREGCHPGFATLGLVDFPSLAVSLNNMLRTWAELPLLGSREGPGSIGDLGGTVAGDGDGFRWESFGELRGRALGLAFGLERLGLGPGDAVGIAIEGNRPEFILADLAAVFSRAVSVGLPSGSDPGRLLAAAGAAGLRLLVADAGSAARLLAAGLEGACPDLRGVVVCGDTDGLTTPGRVALVGLDEVTVAEDGIPASWRSHSGVGLDTPVVHGDRPGFELAAAIGLRPDGDDELYALVFTSGTTGAPKGSPMTRRRWVEELDLGANVWPHVALSFQPQALLADRLAVWQALYNGGRIACARAGAALLDDARAVRPTLFFAPPAVWRALVGDRSGPAGVPQPGRVRRALGGRVVAAGSGGAALEPEVRRQVEASLGLRLAEGYGTTETGPIAADGRLLPNLDFRLLDLPELGFSAADTPWPRGELAVRTPRTQARYVGGDASSGDAFTADGYFRTGDIVEVGPDRGVRIVGRRAELFKLAGAEWIAPAPLEALYRSSPLVEDVFVTGGPESHAVSAVVVPSRTGVGADEVQAELRALAAAGGRRPCEVPAAVVVAERTDEGSPWTPESGLRTASYKLDRRALAARYRDLLEAAEHRAPTGEGGPSRPTAPPLAGDAATAVLAAAAESLGRRPEEVGPARSFADNGGDSVTAMAFRLRLEERVGAAASAVGAEELVTLSLAELGRRLEGPRRRAGRSDGAASRRLAADDPGSVRGQDRAPDPWHGPADDVRLVLGAESSPPSDGPSVLLTGGTGFLGSHLVPLVAGRLGPGGSLYVLVRAGDDDEAARRLGATLAKHRLDRPEPRVVAVAGSLDEDDLGLAQDRRRALVADVGLVYHVGARVEPGRSYAELRRVNVLGTRRVLELAAAAGAAVHVVSSLDVTLLLERAGGRRVSGSTPAPAALPPEVVAAASGYALSKWAAERLAAAAAAVGVRVSVSRPALITWSSATGAANAADWLTRILASCLDLAAVPGPEEAGVPEQLQPTPTSLRGLDLVPVDAAARQVERLGRWTREGRLPAGDGVATVHVGNPSPGVTGLVPPDRLLDLLVAAQWRREAPRGLASVPFSAWATEVAAAGAPAAGLLAALERGLPLHRRFAAAGDDPDACPPVDVALVEAFLAARRGAAEG